MICRFRYADVKVDVMNTEVLGWAPANPWFAPGFTLREMVKVDGQQIQLLPLPYFLASKFAAFNNRGATDARTSHDFEDIVYILDNRTDIVEQICKAPKDVRPWLTEQLSAILSDRVRQEAVQGNLFYETRAKRYHRIIACIEEIVGNANENQ